MRPRAYCSGAWERRAVLRLAVDVVVRDRLQREQQHFVHAS